MVVMELVVVILAHHLVVVVGLHEVGEAIAAGPTPAIQHLLTVLRVLRHHLVMVLLLLLLQLIVESLELRTLVRGARREHGVDFLAKRYLRAEPVDLVVVRVARVTDRIDSVRLLTARGELVEIGCLVDATVLVTRVANAFLIFSD